MPDPVHYILANHRKAAAPVSEDSVSQMLQAGCYMPEANVPVHQLFPVIVFDLSCL